MRFSKYPFSPELQENLQEMGFIRPTDIQFRAIPAVLRKEDLLAIAQTGTGKTAAFAIPMIHLLGINSRKLEPGEVRSLVMVPTRELALQISKVFHALAKNTGLRIANTFGGVDQQAQAQVLTRGADVLISTPGRMFDLRHQGLLHFSSVEILVLDEADQMLDKGFIKDIRDVLRSIPRKHQTLFFSATINLEIKDLAYSIVANPIRIQIAPKERISKNVEHQVAMIEMDDKRFFLERIIRQHSEERILVFVRTRVRADRVAAALKRVDIESVVMHGNIEQKDRISALEAFRSGSCLVLIATDVSARGIDISGVPYVVNYDLPEDPEKYVHRVGRTGRGMQKGFAISFCAAEEKPLLEAIEGFLEKPVQVMDIDSQLYIITKAESLESKGGWSNLIARAEAELGISHSAKPPGKKKKRS
jgi:ATP-dependent RNA helicase RhlE